MNKIKKIPQSEINAKISDALKGNTNAEKWTEDESIAFMNKALELSKDSKYDFIGEVAKDMDSYIEVFDYLAEKFKPLQHVKNQIKRNCEVNCFSNSKKGKIKEATAIVNLKSNHGWTDRQQVGVSGGITLNFDSDDKGA